MCIGQHFGGTEAGPQPVFQTTGNRVGIGVYMHVYYKLKCFTTSTIFLQGHWNIILLFNIMSRFKLLYCYVMARHNYM